MMKFVGEHIVPTAYGLHETLPRRSWSPSVLEETNVLSLPVPSRDREISPMLTALFAFAVGVIVINLFSMQPLVGLVGPALGLGAAGGTLVAAAISLGYAA